MAYDWYKEHLSAVDYNMRVERQRLSGIKRMTKEELTEIQISRPNDIVPKLVDQIRIAWEEIDELKQSYETFKVRYKIFLGREIDQDGELK